MTVYRNLMKRIDMFLARGVGTSPSRFGRDAVNDPRLVTDLRNGRQLREKTYQRIHDYLTARDA